MQNTAHAQDHIYTKENPFFTILVENYRLNKEGSSKDTRHFVISLEKSNIDYQPGDALYVFPENDPNLANELLDYIVLDQEKNTELNRFQKNINITRPSNKLFKLIEEKTNKQLDSKQLAERFTGYSTLNLLKTLKSENPDLKLSSNEIAENSSMVQARAYSIASSLKKHPNEVHLCIARVDEEINGQRVLGLCSNFLSNRVNINSDKIGVYVHSNTKFRLPEDSSKDIIMVGPGTGIAPFRAFIEERNWQRDQGLALGCDWLFFGDQKADFDFIYGNELKNYQEKYSLKVTTAFSRDQAEKIYVQHRMKEHSEEIFKALENGAYFYVCGDARRMAKDVDQALREIISEHGKSPDDYIQNLKDSQRYSRDVY
jgi:sulfite reductase (NADPH) flavoprotein alpha-component